MASLLLYCPLAISHSCTAFRKWLMHYSFTAVTELVFSQRSLSFTSCFLPRGTDWSEGRIWQCLLYDFIVWRYGGLLWKQITAIMFRTLRLCIWKCEHTIENIILWKQGNLKISILNWFTLKFKYGILSWTISKSRLWI